MDPPLIPVDSDIRMHGLLRLAAMAEQEVRNLQEIVVDEVEEIDSGEVSGKLWGRMVSENTFYTLTNFYEPEVLELYRLMQPHIADHHRRGP